MKTIKNDTLSKMHFLNTMLAPTAAALGSTKTRSVSNGLYRLLVLALAFFVMGNTAAFGQTGLQFNGTSQYVTFGPSAPSLNATAFTLEAWIRIEGAGVTTATSGVGGGGFDNATAATGAVPLVTKGRGEGENPANININYFMGLQSNKLVADFEEGTGPNHAVIGVTVIPLNTWTHVAATYEPVTAVWNLYINGVLDKTLDIGSNINPANTSIQHAGIATAMTSAGAAAGFFNGKIDEVRIWNVERTVAQISGSMNSELTSGTGLLGRWGLNEGTGITAANSIAGSPAGTLMATPLWVCGAPALDFIPAAPSALTATAISATQINLGWTDNSTNETGFDIERSTTGVGGTYTLLTTVGASVVSYSDISLTAITEYCYRVRAKNCSLYSGYAGPTCATTQAAAPPAAPTALTATAPTIYQVSLSWTDNSTNETGFEIEHSTTGIGGAYTLLTTVPANTILYNDVSVTASNQYCYRISAINTFGNSGYAGPTCATTPAEGANALSLTPNAYVSFGAAPTLASQNFTVEAWFKRTAAGTSNTTGTSGIIIVPILTKGAPEGDGSTIDANYILGINTAGNVIAADFEEGTGSASAGLNHPVSGSTPIVNDIWYHAAATFTGGVFSVYLNGVLEGSANLGAGVWPQGASIQHAALGTMLTSGGAPNGYFAGVIDEARIWNYARTEPQIQATVNSEITTAQAGLLARWGLNEGSGTIVHANAGTTVNGNIINAGYSWVNPGAPFNLVFIPPAAPTGLAVTPISSTILRLNWTDNSTDETGFQIERSTTGAGGPFSLLTTVAANTVTYDNTGLTASTNYCYRVRAIIGGLSSAYTSIICATTMSSGPVTISFQDGVNSYTGTRDTYTWASSPVAPRGAEATFIQDIDPPPTPDERRSLLRFDLSSIPSGVTISSATLQFYVAVEGQGFNMHRMLVPWDEATVTYTSIGNRHFAPDNTDAESAVNSTWPGVDTYVGLITVTVPPSTIQNWINGTLPNNGWLMIATHPDDGQQLRSRETAIIGDRPKLTVTYSTSPPNQPTSPSPADNGIAISASPNICATVSDPDGGNLTVRYYGRKKLAAGSKITVIGLPDTQFYTEEVQGTNSGGGGHNGIFKAQTQWIANQRIDSSIAFVVQLGDCVQNGDNPPGSDNEIEWKRADTSIQKLENPNVPITDGIPYGICVGNHDQGTIGNPDLPNVYYNQYFGSARFTGRGYYGGHYGANNDNHYELFSGGGVDFIHISIEYYANGTTASLQPVLDWADALLKAYPNRKGIISSHNILGTGNPAAFQGPGQKMYDDLKDNPNLILMLAGHVPGEGRRSDVFGGNTVHTLMSDYQSGYTNGGNGYLRIMQFLPDQNLLSVKTYSPYSNTSYTGTSSQFTLPVNLSAPYTLIGTNSAVASGSVSCFTWPGLDINTEYEWYVEVSDGVQTTTGPVWTFTVPDYKWYGAADGTWGNAANWSAFGVPPAGADLSIATTGTNPTLPGAITVGALRFNAGTTLTLGSNTLTVNGAITGTGTLTGSATSSLTVNGAAGSLNFTPGSQILKDLTINTGASATLGTPLDITAGLTAGTVTVTGTLNTAGLLTIKSNAAGTARVGASTGTISGNVTVERFVQARRAWRFLTAPISTVGAPSINAAWQEGAVVLNSGDPVTPVNDPHPGFGTHITGGTAILGFDQNPAGQPSTKISPSPNVWNGISNTTDAVTTEQGYMVFVRGSRANQLWLGTSAPLDVTVLRVKGTLKTGAQTFTRSAGFQVIGNPYASAITLPTILAGNPMVYSVWDPLLTGSNSVGGFIQYSWNGSAYSQSVTPISPLRDGIVESGSAFIVQFPAGSNTLTLGETNKTAGSVMSQLTEVVGEQMRINLNKVNANSTVSLQDGLLTEYDAPFSNLVDAYDAVKVTNFTESMSSKRDGTKLAIERRKIIVTTDTSYLDLIQMSAGNYQLQLIADNLNHPNLFGKLVDNYLSVNTPISLHGTSTYAFTVDANAGSFAADRFKVVYYPTGPLPVTFTSIKATQQNKNIAVEWQVANQVNISKYEVEKSTDGRHFTAVATQQPIGINGANATYNWLDVNAVTGDHFYRISSTGFSGDIKLSSIVKVTIGKGIPAIVVYPNPVVNNSITLQFTDMPKGDYSTRLINMLGQTVQSNQLTHSGSNTTQSFAISQGIAKGNYQLQIITPAGEKLNQKIVITE